VEVTRGGATDASGPGDQLACGHCLPVQYQATTIDDVRIRGLHAVSIIENDEIAIAAVEPGEANSPAGRSIDGHIAFACQTNAVAESPALEDRMDAVAIRTDHPAMGAITGRTWFELPVSAASMPRNTEISNVRRQPIEGQSKYSWRGVRRGEDYGDSVVYGSGSDFLVLVSSTSRTNGAS
jgi:hypothetical protein